MDFGKRCSQLIMKLSRPLFVPAAVSFFLVGATLAWSAAHAVSGPEPARLVSAKITIDGEVVLKASTSDNGHPDADAVWGYLLTELVFRETEAFANLNVDPNADTASFGWLRSKKNEHLGPPPKILLEVAYGGWDNPYRLGLVRSEKDGTWRVAPETVERRFAYRRITRRQAAELDQPKLRK